LKTYQEGNLPQGISSGDELRKNSHLHYWVPEDIMFVKGGPLKTALRHLDVRNLKRMNTIKKHQYNTYSGGSKPSI
jgi:nickel-dependent lactate racemase